MSRFDPSRMQRSPEEWSEIALKEAMETGASKKMVGGIVLGLVLSAYASPLVGAAAGGYLIYEAIAGIKRKQRDIKAVVDYGAIAHLLDGDNFRQYLRQVGEELVQAELQFAVEEEYDLSLAAEDFLDARPLLMPGTAQPLLSEYESDLSHAEQLSLLRSGGTSTQSRGGTTITQQAPQEIKFTRKIPDLAGNMAHPCKNSLIVGVPGAGKDFFVSNALARLKAKNPKTKIFFIDPKNDSKETGYFQNVDFLFRKDFDNVSASDATDFIDSCLAHYDIYCKENELNSDIKLLVINELPTILKTAELVGKGKKRLNAIKTKLANYACNGGSRGKRVWGMAQNAHVEGCGLNGGDKAIFCPIVIVRDESISEALQILSAKLIPREKVPTAEQFESLCKESPVGRVIYHGTFTDWFPMPKLENLSGFDRDSGKFIGNNNPTKIQPKNESSTNSNSTKSRPTEKEEEDVIQRLEDSFKADSSSEESVNKDGSDNSRVEDKSDKDKFLAKDLKSDDYIEAVQNIVQGIIESSRGIITPTTVRNSRHWTQKKVECPGIDYLRNELLAFKEGGWLEGDLENGFTFIDD